MALWQAFNDIANGFGIDENELKEICQSLKDQLNISKYSLNEKISDIFKIFDTDKNDLIDALEFFSVLAILSGMTKSDVFDFVLSIYDFDGTNSLSIDEVVLSIKSALNGLCKLELNSIDFFSAENSSIEFEIEEITTKIFKTYSGSEIEEDFLRIEIKILKDFLTSHLDISSWFNYFSTPDFSDLINESEKKLKSVLTWNQTQLKAIQWDVKESLEEFELSYDNNPWVSTIAMLTPLAYANQTEKNECPDKCLSPEWIYGYESQHIKNNLFYNSKGSLVYSISKYIVVFDCNKNTQKIFSGHNEEISFMTIHPNRNIIASGETGPNPPIILWNSENLSILCSFQGFHQDGILSLSFSPSGKLLAAIGNDIHRNLALYSWEDNTMIFNSPTLKSLSIYCSVLSNNSFAVCGGNNVYFWTKYPEGYYRRKGIFSNYLLDADISSSVHLFGTTHLVNGTISGHLLLWIDINCIKTVQAHKGEIISLISSNHGLFSSGTDLRIRMWTNNLEPNFTFDISNFGINPSVNSLSISPDGSSFIFGTKGSNIYEISAIDGSDTRGGPVVFGHCQGIISSLSTHPSKFEFVTVSSDNSLRIFDIVTKSQLKLATFDGPPSAVTYNPLGDLIVVGFGGSSKQTKCGSFIVINEDDLVKLHEAKDSQEEISSIAFSPEGEVLSVGSMDGAIFLYSVNDDFEMFAKCSGHQFPLKSIDFSRDGEWIRSNSVGRELLFFNSDDGQLQSNIASLRDVEWASNNCIYNWHIKASHITQFKSELITSSNTVFSEEQKLDNIVACGTNLGYILLFSFPIFSYGSEHNRYPAHFRSVKDIKFSFDGNYLISIGEFDHCIIQWNSLESTYKGKDKQVENSSIEINVPDEFLELELYQSDADFKDISESARPIVEAADWINNIVHPGTFMQSSLNVPDVSFILERLYGYEAQYLRNSLYYVSNDEVLYTTSKYGVKVHTKSQAQNIYKFHDSEISSLAISDDLSLVATGQAGDNAQISVWSPNTLETIYIISEIQCKSVIGLSFSPSNQYLAVISMDQFHTLSIFHLKTGLCVSKAYTGLKRILGVKFFKENDNDFSNLSAVTFGLNTIKFWDKLNSRFPSFRSPIYNEIGFEQLFLCCQSLGELIVVGTCDGNFYVFKENLLQQVIKAHSSNVTTIYSIQGSKRLVSGGNDAVVRLWNEKFECLKEFSIEALIDSVEPKISSVCFDPLLSRIIIGTRGSEILELSIKTGKIEGKNSLVKSHGIGQLWGLSSHPIKEEFVTTGDDGFLRIWDAKSFKLIKSFNIESPSRAVAISPDGKFLAVGKGSGIRRKGKLHPKEGEVTILNYFDLKIVFDIRDSQNAIRALKFSPDNKLLAVGSQDNNIYLYNVNDQYSKRSTIRSHQSPVYFIDFTTNSAFIESVDTSFRVYYTDTQNGITIPTPDVLKDEKWSTLSSPASWNVKGFWEKKKQSSLPLACQKSWGGHLLACGYSDGLISIGNNPFAHWSGNICLNAHYKDISSVCWIAGDTHLISIGTKDRCIAQWKAFFDDSRESGHEGGLSCDDSELEIDGGREYSLQPILQLEESDSSIPASQWQSMICVPSTKQEVGNIISQKTINLQHILGARLADCRNCVFYNDEDHIVFFISCVGVIYNRNLNSQKFYFGHNQPIISMAISSHGKIVSSGELGVTSSIHIWDSKSGKPIKIFKDAHENGVTSISFSSSGDHLVSLGQDKYNSISIYFSPSADWDDGFEKFRTTIGLSKLLWCKYSNINDEFPIVVGGLQGRIYFFQKVRSDYKKCKGVFTRKYKIQPVTCLADALISAESGEFRHSYVCGTVQGCLYFFQNCIVQKRIVAHESTINSIIALKNRFITAGKEGVVKLWDSSFQVIQTFDSKKFVPTPFQFSCHSISCNNLESQILIGMRSGELFELCIDSRSYKLVLEGHSRGMLKSLDFNPMNDNEFVSVGEDGVIKIWDTDKKRCIRKLRLDFPLSSVAWSPDEKYIIVGVGSENTNENSFKDGAFIVLNSNTLELIKEDRKCKKMISDIKYSQNGDILAIASADSIVYIHDASTFDFIFSLEAPANESAISRIDFSFDSNYLRVSTIDKKLFYFSLSNKDIIEIPSVIKDVDWKTHNCPYSWQSQGIFFKDDNSKNVVSCCLNKNKSMIAVGYDDGVVRIFDYPCVNHKENFISIKGFASNPSCLEFSSDDTKLLVIDQNSRSIHIFTIFDDNR